MKNNVEPDFLNQLDTVFAQLNPQAVEEFYAAYRQWNLRQRIAELRQRIDALRVQQADNQQRLRETRPTTIALAALARLQSNGVSDIALLDAMLERGESWLDQTMQRLDYLEQFDDFISDDYTKWCQGALEGAFDWIDSLLESTQQAASTRLETSPAAEEMPDNEVAGDVEVLLLQRLATEDEQDDLSWQEATTLKQTAIKAPPPEIATTEAGEQEPPLEDTARQTAKNQAHTTEYIPQDEPAQSDETPIAPADIASSSSSEEVLPVEDTPEPEPGQSALVESTPIEEITPGDDELHTGDNQPALIESAPSEEPPLTETEITMLEDTPITANAAQNEINKPDEIETGTSEEAAPYEEQLMPTSKPITPARSTPSKRGLIRTLIWVVTGK